MHAVQEMRMNVKKNIAAPHVFVVRVGAKLLGGIEMTLLKFKSGFLESSVGSEEELAPHLAR